MPALSCQDLRLYLVAYDVSRPRAWRRVHRRLKAVGDWMQLSLFLCRSRPAAMAALETELAGLIDPRTDRLLIVDLGDCERARRMLRAQGRGELAGLAAPGPYLLF
jgi:CRISPR-associated protein Cas2